ncbi:hypothetical protein HS3_01358 [Bacillus subtilis]|nr:hypothetical protein HS3_01358 [Bacillus subtilis]
MSKKQSSYSVILDCNQGYRASAMPVVIKDLHEKTVLI